MNFKLLPTIIYILIFTTLTTSCSDFLKGKPKKDTVLEIKQEKVGCLQDVKTDFEKYLKAELQDADLDKTFDCISNTLKEFQNRVEGKSDANSFTSEELLEIFNKFAPEANISPEGIKEILRLKYALVGGDEGKIHKSEIGQIRDLLVVLRAESKKLLPFAPLFRLKKTDRAFKKEFIDLGFKQLNSSLKSLMSSSQLGKSVYHYTDIKKLLINLNFLDQHQKDIIPLIDRVHDVLVGDYVINNAADRSVFFDNVTELLRIYSMQLNGYVQFKTLHTAYINPNFEFVESLVALVENSIQYRKTETISIKTIDALMVEAHARDILPLKVTLETALNFYKMIIMRVLDSGPSAQTNAFQGLKPIHFMNLKREIAIYKIYSKLIEKIAADNSSYELNNSINVKRLGLLDVQNQVREFNPNSETEILGQFTTDVQKQIVSAVEDLKSEFLAKRPAVYRQDKLIFSHDQEPWQQSWQDLARGLYTKMMARELIMGWGLSHFSKDTKLNYITEDGLKLWYSDFKAFGVELKLFDPRHANSGSRSFKEANLFTQYGNGDDKMTFNEAIEFLGILSSGGGVTFKQLELDLANEKCYLNETDVFGKFWSDEKCVMKLIRAKYKNYFANAPALIKYFEKLNDEEFEEFFATLVDVTRIKPENKGIKLETSDLRSFIVILNYIESLYVNYDDDRSGTLSYEEIKKSFPRFRSFAFDFAKKKSADKIEIFNAYLRKLGWGCYSEEDLVRDSFVYLVFNGKTPAATDFYIAPCPRTKPLLDFKGEVDRKTIINTFKILKAVISS